MTNGQICNLLGFQTPKLHVIIASLRFIDDKNRLYWHLSLIKPIRVLETEFLLFHHLMGKVININLNLVNRSEGLASGPIHTISAVLLCSYD